MKLRLSIHDAIVDADVALEIFGLLEGKAEFIERKWQGTSRTTPTHLLMT